MAEIKFTEKGWEDFNYWLTTDKKMVRKVNQLIKECIRTPFEGTGKPEPLRGNLCGFWSRRINQEHRLVYRFEKETLEILQCRKHY